MKSFDLRDLTAVSLFAALTAVCAPAGLPIGPVPIVLATLVSLVSGAVLGKWKGALSQAVYVLMGVVGLPVFSGFASGPGVVAGKTGGYLIGYIAAAFVAGALVQYLPRGSQSLRLSIAFITGSFVIYLFGVPWLAYVMGIDIGKALTYGLYPFIAGDAAKVVAGTLLCLSLLRVPHIWRSPAATEAAGKTEVE